MLSALQPQAHIKRVAMRLQPSSSVRQPEAALNLCIVHAIACTMPCIAMHGMSQLQATVRLFGCTGLAGRKRLSVSLEAVNLLLVMTYT